MDPHAALVSWTLRQSWLKVCCCSAEQRGFVNADVFTAQCPVVVAALSDGECRVAVMGGRQGMPRSLGSVYAGSITRFLGGAFTGVRRRTLTVQKHPTKRFSCMALSTNRTVLVAALTLPARPCLWQLKTYDAMTGMQLCAWKDKWRGWVFAVCVAPDDAVVVAVRDPNHVCVFPPGLILSDTRFRVGLGFEIPIGVAANADVVVVVTFARPETPVTVIGRGGQFRRTLPLPKHDRWERVCILPDGDHVALSCGYGAKVGIVRIADGSLVRMLRPDMMPPVVAHLHLDPAFHFLLKPEPEPGWDRITVLASSLCGELIAGSLRSGVVVVYSSDGGIEQLFELDVPDSGCSPVTASGEVVIWSQTRGADVTEISFFA